MLNDATQESTAGASTSATTPEQVDEVGGDAGPVLHPPVDVRDGGLEAAVGERLLAAVRGALERVGGTAVRSARRSRSPSASPASVRSRLPASPERKPEARPWRRRWRRPARCWRACAPWLPFLPAVTILFTAILHI